MAHRVPKKATWERPVELTGGFYWHQWMYGAVWSEVKNPSRRWSSGRQPTGEAKMEFFLWCKYPHHGQVQAPNVMPPNMEQEEMLTKNWPLESM